MGRAYSIRPYRIGEFPVTFDHNHGLSSNLLNPGSKPDLGLSSHPFNPGSKPNHCSCPHPDTSGKYFHFITRPIPQTSIVGRLF